MALRAADVSVAIVDTLVVMPTMGGRELVERLRARQPDIRVLYISGHTDDAVVRHGVIDASHAFLQKPFAPAAFVSKVHELFAQRKPGKHLLFVDDEAAAAGVSELLYKPGTIEEFSDLVDRAAKKIA